MEHRWQWFFPAKEPTLVRFWELRRYHLHETHVQKAIKKVVKKSKPIKPAYAHTLIKIYLSINLKTCSKFYCPDIDINS